jgi:hypothetical protein
MNNTEAKRIVKHAADHGSQGFTDRQLNEAWDIVRGGRGSTTLAKARDEFFDELETGNRLTCYCCGRTAALGRRTIDASMARTLIHIYRRNMAGQDWVNTSHDLPHGLSSTAALLRHWGLAESKNPVSKGRNDESGLWKVTQLGMEFVEGMTSVPGKIMTWKGKIIKQPHGAAITLKDALGKKFSLAELMREELGGRAGSGIVREDSNYESGE